MATRRKPPVGEKSPNVSRFKSRANPAGSPPDVGRFRSRAKAATAVAGKQLGATTRSGVKKSPATTAVAGKQATALGRIPMPKVTPATTRVAGLQAAAKNMLGRETPMAPRSRGLGIKSPAGTPGSVIRSSGSQLSAGGKGGFKPKPLAARSKASK